MKINKKKALRLVLIVLTVLLAMTLIFACVHAHPYNEEVECITCELLAVIRSFAGLLLILLPLMYLIASLLTSKKRIVYDCGANYKIANPVSFSVKMNN